MRTVLGSGNGCVHSLVGCVDLAVLAEKHGREELAHCDHVRIEGRTIDLRIITQVFDRHLELALVRSGCKHIGDQRIVDGAHDLNDIGPRKGLHVSSAEQAARHPGRNDHER